METKQAEEIIALLKEIRDNQLLAVQVAFNQGEAAKIIGGISRASLRKERDLGRIRLTWRDLYSRAEIERYLAEGCKQNEFKRKAGGRATNHESTTT